MLWFAWLTRVKFGQNAILTEWVLMKPLAFLLDLRWRSCFSARPAPSCSSWAARACSPASQTHDCCYGYVTGRCYACGDDGGGGCCCCYGGDRMTCCCALTSGIIAHAEVEHGHTHIYKYNKYKHNAPSNMYICKELYQKENIDSFQGIHRNKTAICSKFIIYKQNADLPKYNAKFIWKFNRKFCIRLTFKRCFEQYFWTANFV